MRRDLYAIGVVIHGFRTGSKAHISFSPGPARFFEPPLAARIAHALNPPRHSQKFVRMWCLAIMTRDD
jgi:hypothetical protein